MKNTHLLRTVPTTRRHPAHPVFVCVLAVLKSFKLYHTMIQPNYDAEMLPVHDYAVGGVHKVMRWLSYWIRRDTTPKTCYRSNWAAMVQAE